MPYNAKTDANAGYISKEHQRKFHELAAKTKRKKRAMLEWLIEQAWDMEFKK